MPGRRTRRIRPPAGNFQVNAAKTGPRSHRKIIGKVVSAGDGTIFCGDLILTFSSFEQAMTSPSSLPASTPACRQSGSPARQGIWPASARRRSSRVALVPLETQAFKQTRPREHDDELNPKSHTVPRRGERPRGHIGYPGPVHLHVRRQVRICIVGKIVQSFNCLFITSPCREGGNIRH